MRALHIQYQGSRGAARKEDRTAVALDRGAWQEARASFQGALDAAGLIFEKSGPVPEWPDEGAKPPWLAGAYEGYALACYWLDATSAATEALSRQGKKAEADAAEEALREAWRWADVSEPDFWLSERTVGR